jgi:predicted ATPase
MKLLDHVASVPENLVSDIVRFANGIPFFVEEYIIHLQSCGIIIQLKDGSWFFDNSLYTEGQIPASIELLVQERVDKLSVRHQKILKTASVFGTQFFRQALPDLCGIRDPKELLNDCIEHGLVVKDRQNRTYGFRFYRFSHEIIRRCIYNRLTGKQKKELHFRLAVWMEGNIEISGDDNSFLASHYMSAGDKQKGAQYSFRAAEKSFLNHQPEEAMSWYEKFFSLFIEGIITVQPQEFLQALRNVSDLYLMRGQLEKADQLFEALFQSYPENTFMRIQILLCHLKVVFLAQLPEKTERLLKKTEEQMSMLSSAAVGYWDCLGWLRLRQGEYHRMKADYEKSELCFREALELAVTNFEPVLEILALYSLSIIFSICNKQEHVYECCQKGIEISRRHGLIRREAQGCHNLGVYYHSQGNFTEAVLNLSRALSICEETGDIAGLMLGYRKFAEVFVSDNNPGKARDCLLKALEYATIIRSEKEIHRINSELSLLK